MNVESESAVTGPLGWSPHIASEAHETKLASLRRRRLHLCASLSTHGNTSDSETEAFLFLRICKAACRSRFFLLLPKTANSALAI